MMVYDICNLLFVFQIFLPLKFNGPTVKSAKQGTETNLEKRNKKIEEYKLWLKHLVFSRINFIVSAFSRTIKIIENY